MSNIQNMSLEDIMGERFGRYSKYIIQERALPDIRDGLKPVQRRILYSMNKDGNTHDKGYRKSAKSVGNIMGNFHPHGDSSIYDAMVRMSQDWKNREILVEMHGNNGSMDGDPPAAMRYTEARLSEIAGYLLQDIEKNTVPLPGTLTIQKKSQLFCLQPFQTSWSMGLQGSQLVMRRIFRPITLLRSSMRWSTWSTILLLR